MAGVVRRGIDEIDARLIDRDRVERGENADVLHAGVLRHGAAVTVHGEVFHHIHERHAAVEIIHNGACRVRHARKEHVLRRKAVPELALVGRRAAGVNPHLARSGGAADGELLERSAVAAHRVALEVGEDEHGVVVFDVLADDVLFQHAAVRNGKLQIGAFGIENVHVEHLRPAMLAQEAAVLLGIVARALIRRVALDDGAVHRVHNALPEFGVQKVLVALLAGVHLDRDLARKLLAESAVKLQHLFRRDLAGEIYDRLHSCVLLVNACFSASRWTP